MYCLSLQSSHSLSLDFTRTLTRTPYCRKLTINELLVVDSHPTDPSNEPEVVQMVLTVVPRVWVDLEHGVVTAG